MKKEKKMMIWSEGIIMDATAIGERKYELLVTMFFFHLNPILMNVISDSSLLFEREKQQE